MFAENILEDEPYENKNQFQETKISFLHRELAQLKNDLAQYHEILRINKESLKLGYVTSVGNNNFNLSAISTSNMHRTPEHSRLQSARGDQPSSNAKSTHQVLELLRDEQNKMLAFIQTLNSDIKYAQHKVTCLLIAAF